jgi:hypothetical protein
VGDDNSPDDLKSIVSEYVNRLDIVYYRFSDNLGGKDLVGHWERCVDLTKGELWVCLFSDDDVMSENCVEEFYRALKTHQKRYDLYHFNVNIINGARLIIRETKQFPPIISSEDFYIGKASAKYESYAVEYIFSKDIYNKTGGFVNFDMAWGSDIATWVRMGYNKGIVTIPDAKVLWRQSDKNITPNLNNQMVFRKAKIEVEYIDWINKFFKKSSIRRFNKYAFFRMIFHYARVLTRAQNNEILFMAYGKGIIGNVCMTIVQGLYPLISLGKLLKG